MFDEDIKIAALGNNKPKKDAQSSVFDEYTRETAKGNTEKAKELGKALAQDVVSHIDSFPVDENESGNAVMFVQRGVMMTFAAVIAMEENISSAVVHQTAENSFNAELEKLSPDIYNAVSDSGAFSFYYLAYRRGTEVIRRMGQTFAMLCSHDGDPIYQELGEAIYCWFKSFAEKEIGKSGLN